MKRLTFFLLVLAIIGFVRMARADDSRDVVACVDFFSKKADSKALTARDIKPAIGCLQRVSRETYLGMQHAIDKLIAILGNYAEKGDLSRLDDKLRTLQKEVEDLKQEKSGPRVGVAAGGLGVMNLHEGLYLFLEGTLQLHVGDWLLEGGGLIGESPVIPGEYSYGGTGGLLYHLSGENPSWSLGLSGLYVNNVGTDAPGSAAEIWGVGPTLRMEIGKVSYMNTFLLYGPSRDLFHRQSAGSLTTGLSLGLFF